MGFVVQVVSILHNKFMEYMILWIFGIVQHGTQAIFGQKARTKDRHIFLEGINEWKINEYESTTCSFFIHVPSLRPIHKCF